MSEHGLLTTVAYQLGPNQPVIYALEVTRVQCIHASKHTHTPHTHTCTHTHTHTHTQPSNLAHFIIGTAVMILHITNVRAHSHNSTLPM